jgi:hypothetical protein
VLLQSSLDDAASITDPSVGLGGSRLCGLWLKSKKSIR